MKVQTSYTPIDGYTFMEVQAQYGWESLAEYGDWPYSCYMRRTHHGNIQMVEYCEHDVKIYSFSNKDEYKAYMNKLRRYQEV